ncbi:hypothetical protein BDD12DRAFT_847086 [Trichophaea hybrida]|nr:hypothetical protein BDD12DRAFT_847086 [Trichophaea hybrida]
MPFPSPAGIVNFLGSLFTTRTRRLLLPLILFTFTALYLLPLPSLLPSSPSLHVAIINTPRYHFEVVTPLLNIFSRQRSVSRLDLIATTFSSSRFGIRKFLEAAVSPKPLSLILPESVVRDEAWNPDILLLVSCMHDLSSEAEVWATVERVLNSNTKASVVCVLHEVRMWKDPASEHRAFLKKWASRIRFMVLSEHVAISLRKQLPGWDIGTPEILPMFVPVFPIADSELNFSAKEPQQKSIGIPVFPFPPLSSLLSPLPSPANFARTGKIRDLATHLPTHLLLLLRILLHAPFPLRLPAPRRLRRAPRPCSG